MMTRAHVEHWVRMLIVELVGVPAEHVGGTVRLVDDLEMDPLDSVELALELERHLGLPMACDRLAGLGTVDEVMDLVCRQLGLASGTFTRGHGVNPRVGAVDVDTGSKTRSHVRGREPA